MLESTSLMLRAGRALCLGTQPHPPTAQLSRIYRVDAYDLPRMGIYFPSFFPPLYRYIYDTSLM